MDTPSTPDMVTGNQWLICTGAALIVVAVSEVWKLVLRRREAPAERAVGEPVDDHDMVEAAAWAPRSQESPGLGPRGGSLAPGRLGD